MEQFRIPSNQKSYSARTNNSNSLGPENKTEMGKEVEIKMNEAKNGPGFWKRLLKTLLGHAPNFTHLIDGFQDGPTFPKVFFIIVESIFRSISSIIFISNPFSGLIILITMIVSTPSSALLGMISLISGIFTTLWLVRIPIVAIRGGSITFNSFLLGSIIGPLIDSEDFPDVRELIPICIAVGVFVIFCWAGLDGLLSKANIPVLNAACNILSLIFLYSGLADSFRPGHSRVLVGNSFLANETSLEVFGNFNEKKVIMENKNGTLENKMQESVLEGTSYEYIDWYRVLGGIILAQGQIFQTNSIVTSGMVYFSVLIHSPILFFQQLLGAVIGSVIGACMSHQPYNDVYNGGWGYNSLLTSGALGGFLIAFNFQSVFLSIIGSVLTALVYSTLINNGIPALGIPFMLTTWLFLPMASLTSNVDCEDKEDHCYTLYRVSNFTTPEINRRCCSIKNMVMSDDKYKRPKSSVLPI